MTGIASAISPCWGCKLPFMYDPERVPSISIDPETNLSPELGGDAGRAVRQPICPRCCHIANIERAKNHLPLLNEADTIQDLIAASQRHEY